MFIYPVCKSVHFLLPAFLIKVQSTVKLTQPTLCSYTPSDPALPINNLLKRVRIQILLNSHIIFIFYAWHDSTAATTVISAYYLI